MTELSVLLTYISLIAGGLLLILLLLSLVGGLDLDVDIGDTDVDAGGLGLFKSVLTFISVAGWVAKVIISTTQNTTVAIVAAILSGIAAVFLLTWVLRLLLKNQKFIDWSEDYAVGKKGKVYLKIPPGGSGIVHVTIDHVHRELKAKSSSDQDIPTGAVVFIEDFKDGFLIVSELIDSNNF